MQNNYIKPKMFNNKLAKICFSSLHYDIAGSLFYAIGIKTFAEHADFAPGGVTGLSLILNHLFHLPIGVLTLMMNIPLIVLSYKIVGKEFLFKTARTLIVSTIFLDLIFAQLPYYSGDPMLCSVFSGLFTSIGMSLFYMHGSSSGGTDFIIMSVRVRHPYIPFGYITMLIDIVVITLGWPVFGNINAVLYGLICSFVTSVVMDKILYGRDAAKLLVIISDRNDEIARRINQQTGRGSTLLNGTGTYMKSEKDVLLCACSRTQVYRIVDEIHEIAPESFLMVTEASEIFGEGFIEKRSVEKI